MSNAPFPAASPPASARRVLAGGLAAVAAVGAWLWWTTAGSGAGGLLLLLGLLVLSPVLWQLGMVPRGYSVDAGVVRVHRRWLPDSRFPRAGPAERFDPLRAAPGGGSSLPDRLTADTLLMGPRRELTGRGERVYKAVTNIEHGVTVGVRRGSLLISPEDPEAFLRAAREGRP